MFKGQPKARSGKVDVRPNYCRATEEPQREVHSCLNAREDVECVFEGEIAENQGEFDLNHCVLVTRTSRRCCTAENAFD